MPGALSAAAPAGAAVRDDTGAGPSVVLESGTHTVDNLGDVAMLQVAVARLRSHWPDARIGVVTGNPQALDAHCPGVEPLPAAGRYRWLERGATAERLVTARAAGALPAAVVRAAVRRLLRRDHAGDPEVAALAGRVMGADAFVLAGNGGMTSVFLDDGLQALALIGAATALGVPAAAFGIGIGPIEHDALARRVRAVLPRLELIAVREPRDAPRELARARVRPGRVRTTGDDALTLALPADGTPRSGDALGVGIRAAEGSGGLPPGTLDALGARLRAAAARLHAPIAALPVGMGTDDAGQVRHLAGDAPLIGGEDVRTVPELIARAGRSRAVVTGSYHSAVFALGQGVPVVAVWHTPYYQRKFAGLAELFPGGVELLPLQDTGAALDAAIDRAWHAPPELRASLVAAAAAQVQAAEQAYAEFAARLRRG